MNPSSGNQKPNLQDPPKNKNEITSQESSTTKANNGREKNAKKEQAPKRVRVRTKKTKEIENPKVIVENILSKTNYKEANLSQYVNSKFYECPEYISVLREQLKDLKYVSTVGKVIDGFSDINISVLPDKFVGYVNANPSSISSLPCIHQRPQMNRWKEKRLQAKELTSNKKAKKNEESELDSKKKKVATQDKNVGSK